MGSPLIVPERRSGDRGGGDPERIEATIEEGGSGPDCFGDSHRYQIALVNTVPIELKMEFAQDTERKPKIPMSAKQAARPFDPTAANQRRRPKALQRPASA
jgi:hypothetical protein